MVQNDHIGAPWDHDPNFDTIFEKKSPIGAQKGAQNASKMTPKVSLILMLIFASFSDVQVSQNEVILETKIINF